ncbi:MAG: hypothetical protein JXL97_17990 [Bacteroidales bacterium]|nr:hypothetical protein [Bacteroidales bacterium]
MRRIKIKLPFSFESLLKRRFELMEMAKILTNDKKFIVIEEKHFDRMSYIVVFIVEEFKRIEA